MTITKLNEVRTKYGGQDLVDMIHQFLVDENVESQKKRIEEGRLGNFYPSNIGNCQRAVAYQMLGYPEHASITQGQGLLIMENGTGFHNRMESIFERMGIMVAPELSLKDEALKISGRSDAIIWDYLLPEEEEPGEEIVLYELDKETKKLKEVYRGPHNHIRIVEFKSIKSKNFEKLPKGKPLKKHEMQLQLYFHLTGIRKGMVYYENKDTQEVRYYLVEYDEAVVQETLEYIRTVIQFVTGAELPEREGNPLDIMCRYCNYKNICHVPISDEEWLNLYFQDESEAS